MSNLALVVGAAGRMGPAVTYALEKLGMKVLKADWGKYGKAAGPIRNQEIVNVSDIVIAFWNKKSRGTKDTIDKALRGNKPVLVIPFLEDK